MSLKIGLFVILLTVFRGPLALAETVSCSDLSGEKLISMIEAIENDKSQLWVRQYKELFLKYRQCSELEANGSLSKAIARAFADKWGQLIVDTDSIAGHEDYGAFLVRNINEFSNADILKRINLNSRKKCIPTLVEFCVKIQAASRARVFNSNIPAQEVQHFIENKQ